MKLIRNLTALGLGAILTAGAAFTTRAQEPLKVEDSTPSKWFGEVQLYGLGAGMSGQVGVGPVTANIDPSFHDILDHLQFGAMGRARVGWGPLSISTDVIYMRLGGDKGGFSADVDQWMVQPQLEYTFCKYLMGYAGARYNNLGAEISGHGPLGNFRSASSTEQWTDAVVGGWITVPIYKTLSFSLRGDVGGFQAGSDISWQLEPLLNWQFCKHVGVFAGYRWLYTNYETGSGLSHFKYDVMAQGFELGIGVRF